MRDGEMRACGFEDTMPSDFAGLEAEHAPAAPSSQRAPEITITTKTVGGVPLTAVEADAVIAALDKGAWVDLFSKQQWRRAQLTWASGNGQLFMFVSHGGRPHSMTRRSLQRLVINRLVRPLERHQVVQHALDNIVKPQDEEALAA